MVRDDPGPLLTGYVDRYLCGRRVLEVSADAADVPVQGSRGRLRVPPVAAPLQRRADAAAVQDAARVR